LKLSRVVPESAIERTICDYLWAHRLFFWKQPQAGYFDASKKRFRKHASPYVKNGIPDIIVILEGVFIGFEVKSLRGLQSEGQACFQRDVEKSGGFYFLVRSVSDVQKALHLVAEELEIPLDLK
jgi:hypothetical protein